MSRRNIIAVKPLMDGNDWIPNTSSIIEIEDGNQVAEENGKHNLENDLVRDFRSRVSYDLAYVNGTGSSKILPYYNLSGMHYGNKDKRLHGTWDEKPRPVIITGTTAGNTLTVASQTSSFQLTVSSEKGATAVYNLIPNETYRWTESNTGKTGTFETEGTVRQIYIDALPNFRDIGGYTCYASDGSEVGTMKYGKVFRGFGYIPMLNLSDNTVKFVNIDWKNRTNKNSTYQDYSKRVENLFSQLRALGITRELDLRQWHKTYSASSGDITQVSYAHDPGYDTVLAGWYNEFQIGDYGNASNSGIFSTTASYTYNKSVNKASSAANLYECLNLIADTIIQGGIWYHCKTGADRTGVLTAIIMAICGCSIDDIVKEYELTSFTRAGGQPNLTTAYNGDTSACLRTFIKNNVKYTSGSFWNAILSKITDETVRTRTEAIGEVIRGQLINYTEQTPSTYDYGKKTGLVNKLFQPSTSERKLSYHGAGYNKYRFCEVKANAGDKIILVMEVKHRAWFIESNSSIMSRLNGTSNITTGFTEYETVYNGFGTYTYTMKHVGYVLVAFLYDWDGSGGNPEYDNTTYEYVVVKKA